MRFVPALSVKTHDHTQNLLESGLEFFAEAALLIAIDNFMHSCDAPAPHSKSQK
jgi:hypothetical protein